ncbi:YitT family protein [Microbacterium gilvum]|uniref:YitT family protein n=1 Tax=Microbacterium gilvum TaxID=1336204 RepID=A0ABP9A695_9MICO
MSATVAVRTAPEVPPHRLVDDIVALIAGTLIVSLGLAILKGGGAVTGGTAGLSLLLGYVVPTPTGVLFLAINVPFFLFAARGRGWSFTLRSCLAIAMVGALVLVQPLFVDLDGIDAAYAAIMGNVLSGVGVLILFRHGSSLGGFNIVALHLQEHRGFRAGYVLMVLDALVVIASFAVVPPLSVAYSAVGAVILNLIIALNHRPGRYVATGPR